MQARWAFFFGQVSLALAALLIVVLGTPGSGLAAPAAVEPRDILLTVDDLAPGFTLDPRYTKSSTLEGAGPSEQIQYQRNATAATLRDGPLVVGQIVIRLDGPLGAGDALAGVRNTLIEKQGLSPSSEGPNDGGTFTLSKTENDIKLMAVGFIKANMIIVTMSGGVSSVVTADTTLQLAGTSSARLDGAMAR